MHYLYGPVPSRRLGFSLGIDPFLKKSCNHNCIYCQLGNKEPLGFEKIEGVEPQIIEEELYTFFKDGRIADYITFSGRGEPTLWAHLGRLVKFIVDNFEQKKLAVLTNGSTLWRKDIRVEIEKADLVVPTISSPDRDTYLRLHRPNRNDDFERYKKGLIKFCSEFKGEIWAEVMLVEGVNDSVEQLEKLAVFLYSLPLSYIDINTPVRPPAEGWVVPPDEDKIKLACKLFGSKCRVVGKFSPPSQRALEIANLANKIFDILKRRPEQVSNIANVLGIDESKVDEALSALVAKKLVMKTSDKYFRIQRNAQ